MNKSIKNIFKSVYGLLAVAVFFFLLAIIANIFYSGTTSLKREAARLKNYINQYQEKFEKITGDSQLVNKLINDDFSREQLGRLYDERFGLYLFREDRYGSTASVFWSNQQAYPSEISFEKKNTIGFVQLANGYYVQLKKNLGVQKNGGSTTAYGLIAVASEYFIKNDYLPRDFFYSRDASKRIKISNKPTEFPVQSVSGEPLFYIAKNSSVPVVYDKWFIIFLRLTGLFFLLIFLHFLADSVVSRRGPWTGTALLAAGLLAVRIIIYLFPSLFNFRQFELFDPAIYASSGLQSSLGDLLLNAILFCWVMVFAWGKTTEKDLKLYTNKAAEKWIIAGVLILFLIISTFSLASVIKSLISDSKISFDVTDFFSLNIYSAFGFIVLAMLSLAYYYFSQILLRFLMDFFSDTYPGFIYFAIATAGLLYSTIFSGRLDVLFYLPVLVWLLIYTWIVLKQSFLLTRIKINIAGILFWIFIFSVSLSIIMLSENRKVEWERRKMYADKQAIQADPSSERLLNIALKYLDDDFLSGNFYRFADERASQKLRDSILTTNYRSYLNKFDTRIFVFDEFDKPVNNDTGPDYEEINLIYSNQSKPTDNTPELRFYELAFDKFKFITRKIVMDEGSKKRGTVFIISDPKQFGGEALFPELFRIEINTDPENSPIYAVAVYNNKQLVSPSGKYQFKATLTEDELPKTEFEKRYNGGSNELWYRASGNKVVVMARKSESLIEAISLFSYIFCAFLFLVLLVQFISFIIETGLRWDRIKKKLQMNIRGQIHSTVIFISLLSFIIIGIATISFFQERHLRNNTDKLSRTMKIMVNEMQKKQEELSVFDDVIKVYDSVTINKLQTLVEEIADIHDIDVNVYDLEGNLHVTSEGYVYNKGVLNKKMHPLAYFELNKTRLANYVQQEKIGKLSYLSIYAPVRDKSGTVYAYLNIPYFAIQRELNEDISNFLVTIINLNSFIFLIAGIIALFVTNRITQSFSFISDKMKEMSLGARNEPIHWGRNDEIGELVNVYNKMVEKLGESAAALAKSEREGAWREMARQVAHEIKNPLTPMKLSIQYLQKAIDSNQPNVKELSANVAKTLVEQIDHLSKIAFDFSQFANIGNANAEQFDLHEVLASLKDLYRSNPDVEYNWKPADGTVVINADRTHMNRLFTNLLANAVEACIGEQQCMIIVNELKQNGTIRVSISDNGEGIPVEMQSKIFVPNFTTKTSGTGLGLAMCKGIAEQAKGKIWFDTEEGKGSTFHVELPLVN